MLASSDIMKITQEVQMTDEWIVQHPKHTVTPYNRPTRKTVDFLQFMTRFPAFPQPVTFSKCLLILFLNLLDKSCIELSDFVRVEPSNVLTKNWLQKKTSDLLALDQSGDLPSGHLEVANHHDRNAQVYRATEEYYTIQYNWTLISSFLQEVQKCTYMPRQCRCS